MTIPIEQGIKKVIKQKFHKAINVKWQNTCSNKDHNIIDLLNTYQIMSNNQTQKQTKDYFARITNSELKGKYEIKKMLERNKSLTQQQKQYFNKELYQSNICEFEEHRIIENTNHIIMHCTVNQEERQNMYNTIQQLLDNYGLNNKVNIRHHMQTNTNDNQKTKTMQIAMSKALMSINYTNNIRKYINNNKQIKEICSKTQAIILKSHKEMYFKRNEKFFALKKAQKIYKWRFHVKKQKRSEYHKKRINTTKYINRNIPTIKKRKQ